MSKKRMTKNIKAENKNAGKTNNSIRSTTKSQDRRHSVPSKDDPSKKDSKSTQKNKDEKTKKISPMPAKVSPSSNKNVIPISPTSLPVPSTQVSVPSDYNKKVIPTSPLNLPVPSKQTRVPSSYNKKQISTSPINILQYKKPPSLTNIGANCYLNSAFQGISSCNNFVKDINSVNKSIPNLKELKLFNDLISILNGNEGNRMELSRNEIFRNWNKPGQQDSFELLLYVINQVYNEIRNNSEKMKNNIEDWLKFSLPLRLIFKNHINCTCGTELETPLQTDLALHVPIPSHTELDLKLLVNNFFKEEPIEDYSCDNPNCKVPKATRSAILCRPLPRTICIHLQRTYWNGFQVDKKSNKISFDKTLKIESKLCCESTILQDDNSFLMKAKIKRVEEPFQLKSVIVHSGSVYGGHYICYKCVDGRWFCTDDSIIREVREEEVFKCEAYILFYEND